MAVHTRGRGGIVQIGRSGKHRSNKSKQKRIKLRSERKKKNAIRLRNKKRAVGSINNI